MFLNKALEKMEKYETPLLPERVKRQHFNELHQTILPTDVLLENIDKNLNFYPENLYEELTKKAQIFYNINEKKIVPTNGSDEGIDLVIRTFCNPNDKILVQKPTFAMYKQYAEAFQVNIVESEIIFQNNQWFVDFDKLINDAKRNKAKIIFITNPLAHLGVLLSKKDVLKLVKSLPNIAVVVDEAYIEFVENYQEISCIDAINEFNNLIILRTFSKFFGLAGIRLGFVFSDFKGEICKIKSPDNVSALTCKVGINVFNNIRKKNIKERQKLVKNKVKKLSSWLKNFEEVEKVFETNTNFVLVKLRCQSKIFAEKLFEKFQIKIRAFGGDFENYCRISVV